MGWLSRLFDRWRRGPDLRAAAAQAASKSAEAEGLQTQVTALLLRNKYLFAFLTGGHLKCRCGSCGDLTWRWEARFDTAQERFVGICESCCRALDRQAAQVQAAAAAAASAGPIDAATDAKELASGT